MTATYHDNLDRTLDKVRAALGDVTVGLNDADPPVEQALRSDEYYLAQIAIYSTDWRYAAADAAESLAAEYGQSPDSYSESGELSVSWRERVKTWLELATRLRAQAARDAESASAGVRIIAASRGGSANGEYTVSRESWRRPRRRFDYE